MRPAWLALLLVLAGCGGGDDALPDAVQQLERRLEARQGVLHVVTDEIRFVREERKPDLPPGGWSDEIWLDLDGSGWRAHRAARDGGFEQAADAEGVHTYIRGGFRNTDRAEGDFLMRPWRNGMVDPVRLVRRSTLHVIGVANVGGRPAHLVGVDPDPTANTRLYVARDDGDLLRVTHRSERDGRMRTVVQDYLVFEVRRRGPPNLAELVGL